MRTSCDVAIPSTQRPPDPLATPCPLTHTKPTQDILHLTLNKREINKEHRTQNNQLSFIVLFVWCSPDPYITFSYSSLVTIRSFPSFSLFLAFEEGDGHIYTLVPA